jgi:hypothetical protein
MATLLDHAPRPAGAHAIPLATAGWAPGVYVIRLWAGDRVATDELVVIAAR